MNRKELGDSGEEAASRYLCNRGYEILARKYRTRLGEIDIIARQAAPGLGPGTATLVFIEVKTRRSVVCGFPGEAVTYAKQRKIITTAQCYLNWIKQPEALCRFDVMEVYVLPSGVVEYNHIVNAFGN